jgi:hypothetical protein
VGAHPSPRGGQGPQLLQVLVQLPPIRRFPCHGSRRSGTANAPPSFSATDGYLAHADGCGQYGGGCEQERQLGRLESSAWPQEQGGRGDSLLSLVPPFRWCREFDGFLAPQAAARCRVACERVTVTVHAKRRRWRPRQGSTAHTRLCWLIKQLQKHCRNLEHFAS